MISLIINKLIINVILIIALLNLKLSPLIQSNPFQSKFQGVSNYQIDRNYILFSFQHEKKT